MSKTITISLPVTNLDTSKAFYSAIGFEPDPDFSDPTAAMMVWERNRGQTTFFVEI